MIRILLLFLCVSIPPTSHFVLFDNNPLQAETNSTVCELVRRLNVPNEYICIPTNNGGVACEYPSEKYSSDRRCHLCDRLCVCGNPQTLCTNTSPFAVNGPTSHVACFCSDKQLHVKETRAAMPISKAAEFDASNPSPTADKYYTSTFETTRVSLRGGVELAVDYLAVSKTGRFPAIVELTPYGRGPTAVNYRYEATYWRELGYAFVIADCRGTGDSEGEMAFFTHEGEDGYDLIEWIARQPWSNGRVAMRGSSYSGTNQWYIAREQPPHLSCITPSATLGRPMEDVPYFDGAFAVGWALDWIGLRIRVDAGPAVEPHSDPTSWLSHRPLRTLDVYAAGKELPLFRTFLDHPTYDAFWRAIDFTPADFARITIPSLAFTGWFDGTMYGTIWRFQGARRYAPRSADQFVIIGPYTHGNAPDGGYDYQTGEPIKTVGDLAVPDNALLPGLNMTRAFFDWCLKDGPRPEWQPSRIFVTGSDCWMTRNIFPPPEADERSLFLTSGGQANGLRGDGRLQWETLAIDVTDSYCYDPTNPVRSDTGKQSINLPIDFNSYIVRDDVLVYTTELLNKSITVIGNVVVELTVSSTARDTDFVIELMDVLSDGRSIKLGSKAAGQLRARYRDGFNREVLMSPGQIYVVRIDLRAIGHTFLPGHRIRLAIMSSFFPWISANPNTGGPIASDLLPPIAANQTIHYGRTQPSRIRMMVIDDPIFD